MAGASAAYFLRQKLGQAALIEVFEAANVTGGRAHTVTIDGATVDVGASIIWQVGHPVLLQGARRLAGARLQERRGRLDRTGDTAERPQA